MARLKKKAIFINFKRIPKEEIIHQIIVFYFAGIYITGRLIAMTLYAIVEYLECDAKIVEEIRRFVKNGD